MVQTVWNTAHGHFLQMTSGDGVQISRLAAHFDPILAAFAPLWWIWPSPEMLLTVQAIAVALGALPVSSGSRASTSAASGPASAFALVYLLYPATEWLTLNEFHPVALACPFLLFAFWYLDEDRLLPFAVFAVLAMTTKEEVGLVVAGMGSGTRSGGSGGRARRSPAPDCSSRRSRSPSSSRTSTTARLDVLRALRRGRRLGRRDREDALHAPVDALRAGLPGRDLHYLLHLLAPARAAVRLLAPLVALAAVPELALNQLSATPTQTSIHFHYTAAAIPPLDRRLGARRRRARPAPPRHWR